jgi:hypothetical protein
MAQNKPFHHVTQYACLGTLAFITAFALAAAFWTDGRIISMIHHSYCRIDESQMMMSVVFSDHEEYKSLSHDYDYLWHELFTPNGGYINVREKNQTRHDYGISMYHQLHCLQMIRTAIQDLQSQIGEQSQNHNNMHHDRSQALNDHPGPMHWLHCLDYLRQVSIRQLPSPPNGHRLTN